MWICFRFPLIFELPAKKETNIKCLGLFILWENIFSLSKTSNAIVSRSRILVSIMDTDVERRGKFPCFFQHTLEPNSLLWNLLYAASKYLWKLLTKHNHLLGSCTPEAIKVVYRSSSKLPEAEVYWCFGSKGCSSPEGTRMDPCDSAWCISRWPLEVPFSLNTSVFS